MKLHDEYFELVRKKIKKYEIRLNDEKRRKIKKGDIIKFRNYSFPNQYISVVVKDMRCFNSFRDIFNQMSLYSIGFLDETINSSLDKIYKIYNKEDEKLLGVILLEIDPIIVKSENNKEYHINL
jgi:ASC-1-like (ASCH) protein